MLALKPGALITASPPPAPCQQATFSQFSGVTLTSWPTASLTAGLQPLSPFWHLTRGPGPRYPLYIQALANDIVPLSHVGGRKTW
jgi:hypothetical protein